MAHHSPRHKLTRTADAWVKKINGKTRHVASRKGFPTGEDADAEYERRMGELWAMPTAPTKPAADAQLTLKAVADLFGERKSRAGLDPRTMSDYDAAIQDFLDAVGSSRSPSDLTPADFAKARAAWASRFGPDRLAKFVTNVRTMFKWARRPPLRLPEPDYGDEFNVPRKVDFRRDRKASREADGVRLFTGTDVAALLAIANRNLRAMILLALNGGFGNTDLAELPRGIIDTASGWIDYTRGKTGIGRRVPLWPETATAVDAVLSYAPKSRVRPEAWPPALLFVTRQGRPWIEDATSGKGRPLHKDRIASEFLKLCEAAGVARRRRGFYSLRRTFRSIADELPDQRAIALIMGHDIAYDIGGIYVQSISDERLLLVANHVKARLGISDSGSVPPVSSGAAPGPASGTPGRR